MEHLPEHIPPPPQRWDRFLRWYCAESFIDEVQGDLHEQYYRTAEEAGIASARRQFRIQVIRFMRPFRMKHFSELSPFYFQLHMFKHYFTITHRNMWRHRGYSALNILGLSIGMAACMLILHFVDLESSYDHFHISADELYRVQSIGYDNGEEELREACSSHGMGPTLLDRMPEVRGFVRIHPWYTANVITYRDEAGMEKSFFEEKGLYADSNFLDFFNFPLRVGDRSRALQEKKSLLVSVSAAYKYFGSPEEAMGKYLMIGGGRLENEFKVAGVFEDLPQNTHFEFEFLVPMANVLENQQYQNDPGWNWNNFFTYLKASADLDIAAFEKKGSDIVSPLIAEAWDEENYRLVPELIKVKDIHLYSTYVNELTPSGNAYTVYFFGLIGILILLIGWINYINLSTARAISRAKEVGIRKTVGAIKPQLVRQFLFEALFTNLIAAGIAIGLTALTLPYLSEVVGKDLTNIQQSHTSWWWMLAGGLLLGTLLAGLYPALVLSSFRPLAVLKGLKPTGKGGFSLRKVLVVFQFTATVALVAGTVAIYQQLQLMRSEDLGMALDQVMIVKGPRIMPEGSDRLEKKKLFKARLQQIPQVKIAAGGGSIPGGGYNLGSEVTKLGEQKSHSFQAVFVDADFAPTYEFNLLAGHVFDAEIDRPGILVNEAFIQKVGLGTPEQALEERVVIMGDTAHILGVLQDYAWNSLREAHVPFILGHSERSMTNWNIKLNTAELSNTIAEVEAAYAEIFPGNPFDYYFVDEFFDQQYKTDRQFGSVFTIFAGLAMIVACLGLLGLAAFGASLRIKEIGIRKVVGASLGQLLVLLSRDFMLLVGLAVLIGLPLAWWLVDSWLQNFPFRIELGWAFFLIPTLLVGSIALLTIVLNTLRTAQANPVEALRYE